VGSAGRAYAARVDLEASPGAHLQVSSVYTPADTAPLAQSYDLAARKCGRRCGERAFERVENFRRFQQRAPPSFMVGSERGGTKKSWRGSITPSSALSKVLTARQRKGGGERGPVKASVTRRSQSHHAGGFGAGERDSTRVCTRPPQRAALPQARHSFLERFCVMANTVKVARSTLPDSTVGER